MKENKITIEVGKITSKEEGLVNNLVTLEINLKKITNGKKNYETLETLNNNEENFTASGNIWNQSKTEILSAGQILDDIKKYLLKEQITITNPYLNKNQLLKIIEFWENHHLNDLKAGTKAQEEIIKKYYEENINEKYDYKQACKILQNNNMYENRNYIYGSNWLVKVIPPKELKEFKKLIDNITKPKNKSKTNKL
jgi:hypothetical protein